MIRLRPLPGFLLGLSLTGVVYGMWVRARSPGCNSVTISRSRPSAALSRANTALAPGGRVTCVVLGDSTAVGAGASPVKTTFPYLAVQALAKRRGAVHVRNLAVVGARIADLVRVQLPHVGTPDVVLIAIGANDATHRTPYDAYDASLQTLVAGLPKAEVYWATAPDMSVVLALPWGINAYVNGRIIEENTRMRRRAAAFHIVDLFRDGKLDRAEDYAVDIFHPNDAGYAIWGRLFSEAILSR